MFKQQNKINLKTIEYNITSKMGRIYYYYYYLVAVFNIILDQPKCFILLAEENSAICTIVHIFSCRCRFRFSCRSGYISRCCRCLSLADCMNEAGNTFWRLHFRKVAQFLASFVARNGVWFLGTCPDVCQHVEVDTIFQIRKLWQNFF